MKKLINWFLIIIIGMPASLISYFYQYAVIGWAVGKDFYFKEN